jgi:hypothetical protein
VGGYFRSIWTGGGGKHEQRNIVADGDNAHSGVQKYITRIRLESHRNDGSTRQAAFEVTQIPVYDEGLGIERGIEDSLQSGWISIGWEIVHAFETSKHIYALRLGDSCDLMEPDIPRGSTLIVSAIGNGNMPDLESEAIYVVRIKGTGRTVRLVERRSNGLWTATTNRAHEPQKAWTDNLSELIIGKVMYHFKRHG